MKVVVKTLFDVSADLMFTEVRKTNNFFYVTKGLVRFVPLSQLGDVWVEGEHQMKMYLLGFIPFGKQTIKVKYDKERREMRDDGAGQLISKWHHLIRVESVGEERCKYTDEIEIAAGFLTFPVYLFAQCFYRYRQMRWRRLLKSMRNE